MKVGSVKSAPAAASCTAAAVLAWAPLLHWWAAKPPEPQAPPPPVCVKCGTAEAPPKPRGETVLIDAVWSHYAWPGARVDIWWTRDPKAPEGERHHEVIAEDVPVLTFEGHGETPDRDPIDCITVGVTAGQAVRLKWAQEVGWLRALPRAGGSSKTTP